jgi:hypothetical protein
MALSVAFFPTDMIRIVRRMKSRNHSLSNGKIIPRTEPLFEQEMLQCRYPGSHFRHPDVNLFDQIIHAAPKLRIPVLPRVSRLFLTNGCRSR